MKRVFALMLALLMLLSLAACKDGKGEETPEKQVTIYVVTEQRYYENGELVNTATFQYDDHGRPTLIEYKKADGSGRRSELTYDQAGNLNVEMLTQTADGTDYARQTDWDLTYDGNLLTRAERKSDGFAYAFSYDKKGQLVLLEYPKMEDGESGTLWQSYEYDKQGRLTGETQCVRYVDNGIGEYTGYTVHNYSQVNYCYDDHGRLTEQSYSTAKSETYVSHKDLEELDFKVSPKEHYFFYYDEAGKLAYIGIGAEDAYPGGSAAIYSDEDYTFDENGNLVRKETRNTLGQKVGNWTEYTYEAMEVKESEAVMHKRLIHGISRQMLTYTVFNTMDPLFWEMCPVTLYNYHLCNMTFYYLIPYPQFELFL